MLPLDDSRWKVLKGGYKVPYDASVPLARLERGEDCWTDLWENLHHQGDVGEASYASVPHLIRIARSWTAPRSWEFYALVSIIEIERHRKSNPEVPSWLEQDYGRSLADFGALALEDLQLTLGTPELQWLFGAIALSKGAVKLGALLAKSDPGTFDEILEQYDAWSQLYR